MAFLMEELNKKVMKSAKGENLSLFLLGIIMHLQERDEIY